MLRNYLFIDDRRLSSLAEQIRARIREAAKRGEKINLSITGLGVELSEEDTWRQLSTHEKIDSLLGYLKQENLIDMTRPQQRTPEEELGIPKGRPFVLETMLARKVIIPELQLTITPGIKHLAVWVSDPDPTVYSKEDCEWGKKGTFVYLTEIRFDDISGSIYSGCSALQVIANAVRGRASSLFSPKRSRAAIAGGG